MDIPINKIEINRSLSRIRKVTEDLGGLTKSIQNVGLLQPIIVYQKEDGKYELIAGQRRFLAVKELGWENIKVEIIEKPENLYKAKMISLIENTVRKAMVDLDAIDAATEIYEKYGSLKVVSEVTGLEYNTLRKYIKFNRLPKEVQLAVKNDEIDINSALTAVDALQWDNGEVEEGKKVLSLAKLLQEKRMDRSKIMGIGKEAKIDPSRDIDKIISKADNIKEVVYKIQLLPEDSELLKKYANSEGISEDEALSHLVQSTIKELNE